MHHVVVQAASGGTLFVDDSDRRRFLDEFRAVVSECGWQCVAYCLMDTHIHLVICTPEPNLGAGMKLLLGRYAFAHNRRHNRHGHLFGHRYWSRRVDGPRYLRCAALYAVLNPVAAGICSHPRHFRWSSYAETSASASASGVLAPAVLLRTLDDDMEVARVMYRGIVDDAVARLGRRRSGEVWWRTVEAAAARPLETG